MQEFQVLNEQRFPLKVNNVDSGGRETGWMKDKRFDYRDLLPFWRWEHRVTIGYRAREFMVFLDQMAQALYIEEISGGHLERVEDESLFESLLTFAREKGFCEMAMPIMKPSAERFI